MHWESLDCNQVQYVTRDEELAASSPPWTASGKNGADSLLSLVLDHTGGLVLYGVNATCPNVIPPSTQPSSIVSYTFAQTRHGDYSPIPEWLDKGVLPKPHWYGE